MYSPLDRIGGHLALAYGPFDRCAVGGVDRKPVARDLGDVAFFEVREVAGFLDQRLHVRPEKKLSFTDARDERAAAPCTDDVAGFIAAHDRDRVRTVQPLRRFDDRVQKVRALVHRAQDHVRDDFGVGVRIEAVALGFQLLAQIRVVLDDAVVHDRDAVAGDVRVCVLGVRNAVGRPARMRDAGEAGDRGALVQGLQLAHLARRADAGQAVILQNGDAGRVVAAVFQRLQTCDQDGDDISLTCGGYNSAHCLKASGRGLVKMGGTPERRRQ